MQTPGTILISSADYEEPEDTFEKVSWDKVGFEDYFLNKFLLSYVNILISKGVHPKF